MYTSATTVSLTPELSDNPDKTRRDFEMGVAVSLAKAVGLDIEKAEDIPSLDDSSNKGWYLRNQLAGAASGMPNDFPLAPGNPYRAASATVVPAGSGSWTLEQMAEAVADEWARRAQN